jgi:hypothetical protein
MPTVFAVLGTDLGTEQAEVDGNDAADRLNGGKEADLDLRDRMKWERPRRLAHNPEVAGSNPVPATSGNGPRRRLRGPFS